MLVVGLTGGIASGKSTVSLMFRETGIPVICADELAHEVVKPGSAALDKIRQTFGDEFIDSEGNLNRAAMARLVFKDQNKRQDLESIIHPRVAEEQRKLIRQFAVQGHNIVVVDVPLLYESGLEDSFDMILVAYVPPEVQIQRLIARDQVTAKEARSRLDAQLPIDKKKKLAGRIIDNTGPVEHTREQVLGIIKELRALAESGSARMPE
ncbi:MAG: dephospho-CoA kinase [Desulfomonilaceae bacterium]